VKNELILGIFGIQNPEEMSHQTTVNVFTHTTVLQPSWIFLGPPGWAGTRKVNPIWIYRRKR